MCGLLQKLPGLWRKIRTNYPQVSRSLLISVRMGSVLEILSGISKGGLEEPMGSS